MFVVCFFSFFSLNSFSFLLFSYCIAWAEFDGMKVDVNGIFLRRSFQLHEILIGKLFEICLIIYCEIYGFVFSHELWNDWRNGDGEAGIQGVRTPRRKIFTWKICLIIYCEIYGLVSSIIVGWNRDAEVISKCYQKWIACKSCDWFCKWSTTLFCKKLMFRFWK